MVDSFKVWSGAQSGNPVYDSTVANVWLCWGALLVMIVIFAIISMVALQLIDRDKR